MTWMRLVLIGSLCWCNPVSAAAGDPPDSIADAMRDPAVLEQAMKMMQNPMVMDQMRVMMQDPAVKARMQRMLERLGADSSLGGAGGMGVDPEALDKLFERMQDPEVIEKLQALAKNETFQAKVHEMARNPEFAAAAGRYADEMKDELVSELAAAGADGMGGGLPLEMSDDDEDDEDDVDEMDDELDEDEDEE